MGIRLRLARGQIGHVALCDLSDEFNDCPTDAYYEGQCVTCYILQPGDTLKAPVLSTRMSRYVMSSYGIIRLPVSGTGTGTRTMGNSRSQWPMSLFRCTMKGAT